MERWVQEIDWRFEGMAEPLPGEWSGERWNGWLAGVRIDGDTRAAVLDWLRSTGDADTAEDIESIEPDADGLTDLGAGLCVLAAD